MKPDSFWRDRRVFVTGGTGLLGGWLVDALVDRGACVTGLIRDHVPDSRLISGGLDRINVVWGSIEKFALVERALNEYETDIVFHVAAQPIVGIANRNPRSTFESNIKGTWNVLEAARRCPTVKAIVVASSDKAYGEHDKLPYEETAPLQGRHPYDVSKSCADLIALSYAATYGLPVSITRCGNFYGGGDLNFNRLVPGTIRSVLRGEAPIIRSDGTFERDYIYIEDAVDAYLTLGRATRERPEVRGQAFNFSTESPLSALQMVQAILKVMGRAAVKPKILGEAQNEIPKQYLSARKAREILGWKHRFPLDKGLRRTVEWYRKYFK